MPQMGVNRTHVACEAGDAERRARKEVHHASPTSSDVRLQQMPCAMIKKHKHQSLHRILQALTWSSALLAFNIAMSMSRSPSPLELYAPSTSRRLGGGAYKYIRTGLATLERHSQRLTCSRTCHVELMTLLMSESGVWPLECGAISADA